MADRTIIIKKGTKRITPTDDVLKKSTEDQLAWFLDAVKDAMMEDVEDSAKLANKRDSIDLVVDNFDESRSNLFIPKRKVLVYDDNSANIQAVKQALASKDIDLDIVQNPGDLYDLLKDSSKFYHIGIFDRQFPNQDGILDDEFGDKFAASVKQGLHKIFAYAKLTAGIDHHNCTAAFVNYCFMHPEVFNEITEIPKTDSRSWNQVYDRIANVCFNEDAVKLLKKLEHSSDYDLNKTFEAITANRDNFDILWNNYEKNN